MQVCSYTRPLWTQTCGLLPKILNLLAMTRDFVTEDCHKAAMTKGGPMAPHGRLNP